MKYGVDYQDQYYRTPLMYAVLGNQPRMCEVRNRNGYGTIVTVAKLIFFIIIND